MPASKDWDSLSPSYRARLLRNGVTRAVYERVGAVGSADAKAHRVVMGYVRAVLKDRVARGYFVRQEAAEYYRIAQGDFAWAKGFAALLHLQNQAIQETVDRRGSATPNRGKSAGRASRELRDALG